MVFLRNNYLCLLIIYPPWNLFDLNLKHFTGSGAGWNASLSLSANFSEIFPAYQQSVNRTQPTGFSSHWSFIGGWPCSPTSNQYGGFGGGGAGCFGGGGGGGFIGGHGGSNEEENGQGGYSFYNPEAVVLVLDSRTELSPKGGGRKNLNNQRIIPELWDHQGPGFVYVIPPQQDSTCQVNVI